MNKMGDFRRYNDYELLYLVRANIDEAKDILLWKYSFLIKSRIHKYNVPFSLWDDFYQEGCLMLYKAIRIFDDSSKMSFTNFFDLLLKRRFLTLLKKEKQEMFCDKFEDLDDYPEFQPKNEVICLFKEGVEGLSSLEQIVYEKIIIQGCKVETLSQELGISSKSISNAKQRIIKKIKNKLKKFERQSI